MASIKCKMMTGKCHLQAFYKMYGMVSSALCQLCKSDEDLLHMVTSCKKLEEIRAKNVAYLENTVSSEDRLIPCLS